MINAITSLDSAGLAAEMRKASAVDQAAPAQEADKASASFADFMANMGTSFVDNLKAAETTSMNGVLGKASVREVVETVMTADQTLQTAMAFRDKIVSAYLEVVKMPI
jgi:flagellar hook-basal body complex protein FliE